MGVACPEPKPATILLLTLAGVAGGAVRGWLLGYGDGRWLFLDSCIGGGIGAAVGASIAVARRSWIRLTAAPILGFFGAQLAYTVHEAATGRFDMDFLDRYWIECGIQLGAVTGFTLAVAHVLFMRKRWIASPIYLLMGALSFLPHWFRGEHVARMNDTWYSIKYTGLHVTGLFPGALIAGAAFGLFQLLGMLAAQAVDRRVRNSYAGLPGGALKK